ncbi:hypothetical protein [Variovorax rhizosphaerae]|uniref:Rad50/SbcC-type AAA domain-containing protein n=1 Tax=Variovorax rhizosphaerae TaxID=1836200 RepID=A0ABU8WL31_9BURK
MGFLNILKVEYLGDKYFFESPPLNSRLSIIEGSNGTGKSTFFNLIYYGLGGKVTEFDPESAEVHKEVMRDTNNLVRLVVKIGGELFTLTRKLRDNFITVFQSKFEADGVSTPGNVETFPLFRREEGKTFSDWLLERLDIAVVEIFQGSKSFKLNFADLGRLIYHNQSPDPLGIYKPADNANFISDSLEIRRAIFQILVGKTLLELYEAMGRQKSAERETQSAKAVHQEYLDIVGQLLKASGVTDVQNTKSLSVVLDSLEAQILSLLETRRAFSRGELGDAAANKTLQADASQAQAMEAKCRSIDEQRDQIAQEAARLVDVERSIEADIDRINKVIYAHGQLKLFSQDTCPYCLNEVQRTPGHCVCGHGVDERSYQRFFYSSAEYLDILRSKSKTLETLRIASKGMREESNNLKAERERIAEALAKKRERIEVSAGADRTEQVLEELDDKLLETRDKLAKSQEAFRLESKLAMLLKRVGDKKAAFDAAKRDVIRLDLASRAELQLQIESFNRIYNDFMTSVVSDCRNAAIDTETYLPVINNGEYREASAKVPKRFLYYLTLLQLSLLADIPFPRLLLVDTPETAGIDLDVLIKMLRQVDALQNPKDFDYQIILSTGVGKYPPEFDGNVALRLTKEDRLLQTREHVA